VGAEGVRDDGLGWDKGVMLYEGGRGACHIDDTNTRVRNTQGKHLGIIAFIREKIGLGGFIKFPEKRVYISLRVVGREWRVCDCVYCQKTSNLLYKP